jgi:hypothetical protein
MRGGHYDHPLNGTGRSPVARALLGAMDRWAEDGTPPPASRYPRIDDGTLVAIDVYRQQFPDIPGVREPMVLYEPFRLDPGPRWDAEGISDHVPPLTGPRYVTLVPAVDEDGNEKAGIHLPDVAVPVATLTGWNLRSAAWGADGMLTRFMGSTLDFSATPAERQASGDPRRAILERYPTREVYLQRVREAVEALQEQGFMLAEDAQQILSAAEERDFWE